MKRNLDLVRCILLQVEKAEDYLTFEDLYATRDSQKNCEYTNNEIDYHVELLIAHKAIDGRLKRDMNGNIMDGCIYGLTWEGADFLESMRDRRIWTKARQTIKETVGTTTLDVVKQTCTLVATQMIKNKLGA